LGIQDTGFQVPEENIERFSVLYGGAEQGGLEVVQGPNRNWRTQYPISGSTGLLSNAPDYMRFAQMLLNGGELDGTRLLGRNTVELMTENHLPRALLPIKVDPADVWNRGSGYGLGFKVLIDVAESGFLGSQGEYGWGGFATTRFWIDPREELIGLIMAQFVPTFSRVLDEFKVLTYQAIED
ncbi:MAG: serine hydrolase, partial [Anaerolineales bacterium]